MIKVKAKIRLYENGRKSAFKTGYRPLFNFIKEMKTSGQITLYDRIDFAPGKEGTVEIKFLHEEFLGQTFDVGTMFTFGEGIGALGEGVILELI